MSASPCRSDSLRIRARLIVDARTVVECSGQVPALNELARRNDVGVGTVYRHFGSAQGLLEALAADPLEQFLAVLAEPVPDPVTHLHHVMREQVRLERENRGLGDVLTAENSASPVVADLMLRIERAMDEAIKAAQQTGRVRADLTASRLRRLLCGIGFAAKQSEDDPDGTAAFLDIVITGLAPARPNRSSPPVHVVEQ